MLRWAPHEHCWVGTHMSVSRYSPSTKLNTLRRVLKIDGKKKGEALDYGEGSLDSSLVIAFSPAVRPRVTCHH